MAKIDLGKVKGDKGDAFTYEDFTPAQLLSLKGDKGDPGADGVTPELKVGTVTTLEPTESATVTPTVSGNTTTLNFGIPRGETGDLSTVTNPTFTDTTSTYTTLDDANDAAQTTIDGIQSKVSLFTILSNIKKSFSAMIQGLKILATNVGAIEGITDSLAATSSTTALSANAGKSLQDQVTELNTNLEVISETTSGIATHGEKFDKNGGYFVRNGLVCVTLESTPNSNVATGDVVLYGLPKPPADLILCLTTATGNYNAIIKKSGQLEIYFPGFTTPARIDTIFTYPTVD